MAVSVNWGVLAVGVLIPRALRFGVRVGLLLFGNSHSGSYTRYFGIRSMMLGTLQVQVVLQGSGRVKVGARLVYERPSILKTGVVLRINRFLYRSCT